MNCLPKLFLTIDQELRRQTKFVLRQICGVKFLVLLDVGDSLKFSSVTMRMFV